MSKVCIASQLGLTYLDFGSSQLDFLCLEFLVCVLILSMLYIYILYIYMLHALQIGSCRLQATSSCPVPLSQQYEAKQNVLS